MNSQRNEHDDEEGERDVEIGDVEDALVRDRQIVAEQRERLDVEDPVRAAGHVVTQDAVAVVRDGQEDLEEEERHDRQVVADESARR